VGKGTWDETETAAERKAASDNGSRKKKIDVVFCLTVFGDEVGAEKGQAWSRPIKKKHLLVENNSRELKRFGASSKSTKIKEASGKKD